MVAAQRGDQLLADGVERRVGDLGEQLGEVVEQQPGPRRQHGDGRVGAHRAQRLGAGAGHGLDQDLELLGGVAEDPLAVDDRAVGPQLVGPEGQAVQLDQLGVQPLLVGVGGGQAGLELVVADDAALGRVDQEHAAGLEAALVHDPGRVDVEHAHLRGHDDQVVGGDPVARRAQPVAVEHRADHGAVGEGDGGRAVPRLHERRVVPVEGPLVERHRLVVLPRLGDHHQHRVGQLVAAQVQQLEDLVEGGRVAGAGRADREDAIEVAGRATRCPAGPRGPASSCGCPARC